MVEVRALLDRTGKRLIAGGERFLSKSSVVRHAAFSLVELLVVIAILSLLAVLALPAVSSILRGSNINRAGQIISDQFSLARQEAVSKNRDVEVRFYFLANGPTPGWRGVQLWRIEQTPNGPVTNSSSRVAVIPDGILISTNLSPLLTAAPQSGSTNLPVYGATAFRGFRFRASGGLEAAVSANNSITLVSATDTGSTPANYYTMQINAQTGKIIVFRP